MIQVLKKTAVILDLISNRNATSLTELSEATGIHKSTLSHIMKTLVSIQYVEKSSGNRYIIGSAIKNLDKENRNLELLQSIAENFVLKLNKEIDELVAIVICKEEMRLTLAKIGSTQGLTVNTSFINGHDNFDNATGKILLAHMDADSLSKLFKLQGISYGVKEWQKDHTKKQIIKELNEIKHCRIATWSSSDNSIKAISVPVFFQNNLPIAIGIAYPAIRCNRSRQAMMIERLKFYAEAMALSLTSSFKNKSIEIKPIAKN